MKKGLLVVCFLAALSIYAEAAPYDIKEMTPSVKAALEARRDRFDELQALKSEGKVGENNSGYVEVISGGGEAGSLVEAENQDRRLIYEAIVEQNNLGSAALNTVESVFAGVQRDKAAAGEKVQDNSGKWTTK